MDSRLRIFRLYPDGGFNKNFYGSRSGPNCGDRGHQLCLFSLSRDPTTHWRHSAQHWSKSNKSIQRWKDQELRGCFSSFWKNQWKCLKDADCSGTEASLFRSQHQHPIEWRKLRPTTLLLLHCYKSLVAYGYSGNLWCSYFKSGIACGRHSIVVLRYKPILLFLNLVLHVMMDARSTLLLLWLKSFLLIIKDEALTTMIFLWTHVFLN